MTLIAKKRFSRRAFRDSGRHPAAENLEIELKSLTPRSIRNSHSFNTIQQGSYPKAG